MKKNHKLTEQFIHQNIKINASFSSYPIRQGQASAELTEAKVTSLNHNEDQLTKLK